MKMTFGKKIGGDIIEKKKTFLYIKTLELLSGDEKSDLISLYNSCHDNPQEKILWLKTCIINAILKMKLLLKFKNTLIMHFKF